MKACRIAAQRSGIVRAAALRNSALSFAKTCSIGLELCRELGDEGGQAAR
jgi:hypothetical protein